MTKTLDHLNKLEQELTDAMKVIAYYADPNNWHSADEMAVHNAFTEEDVTLHNPKFAYCPVAGKKARYFLDTKKLPAEQETEIESFDIE